MKQLFVRVMLVCITTATSVFADSLDAGLGADRSSLSREQIAARSAAPRSKHELFAAAFSGGARCTAAHFQSRHLALHRSRCGRARPRPDDPRGNDLHRELRRSAGEKPDRAGGHRADDQGIGSRARTHNRKKGACRIEGRQENAMGGHGQEPAEGRADDPAADLQDDRRALRSRARNLGDGAAREQSPVLARRPRRFRDSRVPHGRRPDGEAAVGVFRAHDPRS